jgi:hypothetical protein
MCGANEVNLASSLMQTFVSTLYSPANGLTLAQKNQPQRLREPLGWLVILIHRFTC